MPRGRFSSVLSSPSVDLFIDMGNPFVNLNLDGFLKIETVGAPRVAAGESYHCVQRGSISTNKVEHTLKKMREEGAHWGTVAGIYVGMEYEVERIRGTNDWENALIGGAITGALISVAGNNNKDKVAVDAITGGAVATAAKFINYLIKYLT